jgi:hypothetical protein
VRGYGRDCPTKTERSDLLSRPFVPVLVPSLLGPPTQKQGPRKRNPVPQRDGVFSLRSLRHCEERSDAAISYCNVRA